MAGKKQQTSQTSKGERRSVRADVLKTARREHMNSLARSIAQREAWEKGKNVMLTIPNPDPNARSKRFIRVNAEVVWGKVKKPGAK